MSKPNDEVAELVLRAKDKIRDMSGSIKEKRTA